MIGHIYCIRNIINNKVYIGQTIQSVRDRFMQHRQLALKGEVATKLYKAMHDIGVDNFYVEELCSIEVNGDNLTQLEKKYIKEYNSIINGYNTLNPVGSSTYTSLFEYYGDQIIDMYLNGQSLSVIADRFRISRNSVSKIVSGLSEFAQEVNIPYRSKPYTIIMYDKNFEPKAAFKSIKDAIRWILANTNYKPDLRNGYNYIKAAMSKGNIAYGHRWQSYEELCYSGMVFRTKFDKENFINGEQAIPVKDYYICGDISHLIRVGGYRQLKHSGIQKISEDGSQKKTNQSKLHELHENPEKLHQLLKVHNYSEIGRMFDCTPNAIKRIALKNGFSLQSVRLEGLI